MIAMTAGTIPYGMLHHAAQQEVHGAWMTEELARHGYAISPSTLYPTLPGWRLTGCSPTNDASQSVCGGCTGPPGLGAGLWAKTARRSPSWPARSSPPTSTAEGPGWPEPAMRSGPGARTPDPGPPISGVKTQRSLLEGLCRRETTRVRCRGLQGPQRRGAFLQPFQAVERSGHSLRQARHHLPGRGRPPGLHPLASPIGRHALVLSQRFADNMRRG